LFFYEKTIGLDTNLSDKLVSEKEKVFLVEKGIAGSYSANYVKKKKHEQKTSMNKPISIIK